VVCRVPSALVCSLSGVVYCIVFVCRCEVCGHVQVRAGILRYCVLVGRVMFFKKFYFFLWQMGSVESGMGRYELMQRVDIK
jgi:hypothetical protein